MQREEHGIFLRKLIQRLGLLRNMSYSSCVCVIWVVRKRHKAITRNGVPQKIDTCSAISSVAFVTEYAKGRARHIPAQTDTVVRFAPEHVVLFLYLSDLGS